MWAKDDSQKGMNWQDALAWVQARNRESYLGHNDWRLPSAKELQSIVDYTRCPDTTHFGRHRSRLHVYAGHQRGGPRGLPVLLDSDDAWHVQRPAAVYISFGRSLGYMFGQWRDVHGAGSQRSDPSRATPRTPAGPRPPGRCRIRI